MQLITFLASEEYLPWNHFALIQEGYARRNDVAHRVEVLPRGECWRYIDGIKAELTGWGILHAH